jgi:hypothetical protein
VDEVGWRVLWAHDWHRGHELRAAAIGVVPGDPALVLLTEEHQLVEVVTADNTMTLTLADGAPTGGSAMFKWPINTPRVAVAEVDGQFVGIANTRHGLYIDLGEPVLGGIDEPAEDIVAATVDGRPVVVAAWDHRYRGGDIVLRSFDLATGAPAAPAWSPPIAADARWDSPDRWVLGRRSGRPVAGYADFAWITLWCAVTGDPDSDLDQQVVVVEATNPDPGLPWLVAVDDRAGPDLAVLALSTGVVWLYDLTTEEPYRAPLDGYPGRLTAARLGRWRDRAAIALITDTGFSLFDLDGDTWVCHVELGVPTFDVAFAPPDLLAVATGLGPMLGVVG